MSLLKGTCIMVKPLRFLFMYVNSKQLKKDKFTIPSFIFPIFPLFLKAFYGWKIGVIRYQYIGLAFWMAVED